MFVAVKRPSSKPEWELPLPDLFGLIEATSNAGGCVAASATLTGTVVATSPTAQTSDMPLSETLIAARLIIP
jgi:hypothetical protein